MKTRGRKSKYVHPSFDLGSDDVYRVLAARTQLSAPQIRDFLELWHARSGSLTEYGRKLSASSETIRRYFAFLNAALVYGVDLVVAGKVSGEQADLAVTDVNKANEIAAELREQFSEEDLKDVIPAPLDPMRAAAESSLTKQELVEIVDRQIREHDRNGGKAADLATLIDKRARLEGMYTAEQKKEIDVEKTLGRKGLAGIDDTIAERLALLMRHYPKACPAFATTAKRLLSGVEEAPAPASTLPDAGEAIPTEPPPPISEALE